MNHITNPRILNLIRQKSRCCKGRNKFKFTITSRWRDIAEVTCPTMVTRIFFLSFRIRYFHALLDNSCMLEVIPDSPFTPCNTMWCDTTRRGEPCLKLFRNEIFPGNEEGLRRRETFCSCRPRAHRRGPIHQTVGRGCCRCIWYVRLR